MLKMDTSNWPHCVKSMPIETTLLVKSLQNFIKNTDGSKFEQSTQVDVDSGLPSGWCHNIRFTVDGQQVVKSIFLKVEVKIQWLVESIVDCLLNWVFKNLFRTRNQPFTTVQFHVATTTNTPVVDQETWVSI